MSSSRAIEAARAFIRITGDDNPLRKTLRGMTGLLTSTAASAGRILGGIGQFATGSLLAGGIQRATAAVFDFAKSGAAIDDMSKRTGASAEVLSQLAYAAEQSGTSIDDIERGMRELGDVTTEAARGSDSAQKALARIGLSAESLNGLSPEQRMLAVAEGLKKITDPAERASMAMDLMGKSGANLLPMMEDGAGGIQKMMAEADALGLTLTGDQAAAAAAFDDAWAKLTATFGGLAKVIGAAVAPVLVWMMDIAAQAIPIIVTVAKAIGSLLVEGAQKAWAALGFLRDAFAPLIELVTNTFQGILAALSSGDIGLAAKIYWLYLKTAFLEGIQAISHEWTIWKKVFLDVFSSALSEATKKWHTFQNYLSKKITGLMAYLDSSIDVDAVNAELDVMLTEQLNNVDQDAAANQVARDRQFESDIGQVNSELEKARAEWAAAVEQAKTQANNAANEPNVAAQADDKFTRLIEDLKTGEIATRIDAAVKGPSTVGDLRTVSGAGALTAIINAQGTLGKQQLGMLSEIRRISARQLVLAEREPEVVKV